MSCTEADGCHRAPVPQAFRSALDDQAASTDANLAALTVSNPPELSLAETPGAYGATRAARRSARRSRTPAARGRLLLASTDPRVQPLIQLNFAADPEALRRLVAGVRLAWQIAHEPEIARHMHHVALLSEETIRSDNAPATYVRATV
jgi:hypothetical protein